MAEHNSSRKYSEEQITRWIRIWISMSGTANEIDRTPNFSGHITSAPFIIPPSPIYISIITLQSIAQLSNLPKQFIRPISPLLLPDYIGSFPRACKKNYSLAAKELKRHGRGAEESAYRVPFFFQISVFAEYRIYWMRSSRSLVLFRLIERDYRQSQDR